jgi:hypothetical protein
LDINEHAGGDIGSRARPGVEGAASLEVRWLSRGPVPHDALTWLGPFSEPIEERDDRYLATSSEELGVKIRGGRQLDLKMFRGSPGELTISEAIRGRLESWERWSFPLTSTWVPPEDAVVWLTVRKRRSRRSFRVSPDLVEERPLREVEFPGCTLELTEVEVEGATWWTLGLEARGDLDSVEPALPPARSRRLDLLRDVARQGSHPGSSRSSAVDAAATAAGVNGSGRVRPSSHSGA